MLFVTDKKEDRKSWWIKVLFNISPLYKATGAKVIFCSSDFQEVHVKLKKSFITRNYVNTIFGGSIYSSVDPVFMLMLMQILGKEYVVWDKSAAVRFVRPARKVLKTRFLISEELIGEIKQKVVADGEMNLELPLESLDENDVVCAVFTKTLYIADKNFYSEKRKQKGHSTEYKTLI